MWARSAKEIAHQALQQSKMIQNSLVEVLFQNIFLLSKLPENGKKKKKKKAKKKKNSIQKNVQLSLEPVQMCLHSHIQSNPSNLTSASLPLVQIEEHNWILKQAATQQNLISFLTQIAMGKFPVHEHSVETFSYYLFSSDLSVDLIYAEAAHSP